MYYNEEISKILKEFEYKYEQFSSGTPHNFKYSFENSNVRIFEDEVEQLKIINNFNKEENSVKEITLYYTFEPGDFSTETKPIYSFYSAKITSVSGQDYEIEFEDFENAFKKIKSELILSETKKEEMLNTF